MLERRPVPHFERNPKNSEIKFQRGSQKGSKKGQKMSFSLQFFLYYPCHFISLFSVSFFIFILPFISSVFTRHNNYSSIFLNFAQRVLKLQIKNQTKKSLIY
tara:strand:+ start:193 stop:498 length:306 start_codon:yes stop_codon:yes gene_type:complete